jgi:hypothetical protein
VNLLLGLAEATAMDLASLRGWLETSVTLAMLGLLILGRLVPREVVERQIVAPLNDRIKALEDAIARKDAENAALVQQMAAAVEGQAQLLEQAMRRLLELQGGGGD